jgi:hypothetical protein
MVARPLRESTLIQAYGGSSCEIQRFGGAIDGHDDCSIGEGKLLGSEAAGFVAEQPRGGAIEIAI